MTLVVIGSSFVVVVTSTNDQRPTTHREVAR
jgi:hypothetical protein